MKKIKISFAELAKKLNIDLNQVSITDISKLKLEIKSFDIVKNEEVFKPLTHFIVKEPVKKHCIISTDSEELKTTVVHRTWNQLQKEWETSYDRFLKGETHVCLIDEPMQVVDCTVKDTECYIANGQINHNTTPGGKALKFAASVRIKLEGKTPVKIMDPTVENQYRTFLTEWDQQCKDWKAAGGSKGTGMAKPAKPVKPKGDEIIIGYDVIAKTIKNKIAPPKREAEFRIVFTRGIVEEYAWLDYAIKYGLVDLVNSFTYRLIEFPDAGHFTRDEWVKTISDVEIYEHVRSRIKTSLIRPIDDLAASAIPEDEEDPDEKVEFKAIQESMDVQEY